MVVQVPQWMSVPGLTAISPIPPHSSIRLVSAGLPNPCITTMQPPTKRLTSSTEEMLPPNSVLMSRL